VQFGRSLADDQEEGTEGDDDQEPFRIEEVTGGGADRAQKEARRELGGQLDDGDALESKT
jgi:hypothetical protein